MKLRYAHVAALFALAITGQSLATSVTTLQLSAADPNAVPVLTYTSGVGITSVSGNFTLAGQNGVNLLAGQTGPATLSFTGFDPVGVASNLGVIDQTLVTTVGTVTLTRNSDNLVLLSGTVGPSGAGLFLIPPPGQSGSLLSITSISYDTTTPIYADFAAKGDTNPGSFSFNLQGFNPGQPSITPLEVAPFGILNSFTANIGGSFAATQTVAPLPASFGVGLVGLGLLSVGAAKARRKVTC